PGEQPRDVRASSGAEAHIAQFGLRAVPDGAFGHLSSLAGCRDHGSGGFVESTDAWILSARAPDKAERYRGQVVDRDEHDVVAVEDRDGRAGRVNDEPAGYEREDLVDG